MTTATSADLGLPRELPAPGAERLVRELLRRGLSLDALPAACRLAAELEEALLEERERREAGAA